jgi:hypothetical protein
MDLLKRLADEENVPFLVPQNLEEAVAFKTEQLLGWKPKLFINVGGGEASLGNSGVLIPSGLLLPEDAQSRALGVEAAGGVIAEALRAGIPVLHMLGVKKLAEENGIPWDAESFVKVKPAPRPAWVAAGLILFFAVLCTHKRWFCEDARKSLFLRFSLVIGGRRGKLRPLSLPPTF